jgi:hypothetical protein
MSIALNGGGRKKTAAARRELKRFSGLGCHAGNRHDHRLQAYTYVTQ